MSKQYSLTSIDSLPEGTTSGSASILISGGPMTGKESLAYDLLANGANEEESTVIISPTVPANNVYEHIRERLRDDTVLTRNNFGIVDATGSTADTSAIPGSVQFTESAGDLTGIGIELSKEVERAKAANKNVRVAVMAISPLIMYSNVETAYRFLHVLNSRIQAVGALGIFVLDSSAHDSQTLSLLTSLFDIKVSLGSDASETTVSGLSPASQ